jgi:hypothetical protein
MPISGQPEAKVNYFYSVVCRLIFFVPALIHIFKAR